MLTYICPKFNLTFLLLSRLIFQYLYVRYGVSKGVEIKYHALSNMNINTVDLTYSNIH